MALELLLIHMATESGGRSYALLFAGGLVFLIVLAAGLYLIKLFFFSPPKPLSQDTFNSRLEQRKYYDEKLKKEVTYWVIATTNKSSTVFYDCRFQVTAKGTEEVYDGFFKDYTERDCYQYRQTKDNYDCRLENWWKHTFSYYPSLTLRKFNPQAQSEIAVSRFHQGQTRSQFAYSSKNQLSDIYSYTISCKLSSGRKVTHTQPF